MSVAASGSCRGCAKGTTASRTLFVRTPRDLTLLRRRDAGIEEICWHESLPLCTAERQALRRKLLRLHSECGCTTGGIAFAACALGLVGIAFLRHQPPSLSASAVAVLLCLAAAGIAKLAALAVARWRLENEIGRLSARFAGLSGR